MTDTQTPPAAPAFNWDELVPEIDAPAAASNVGAQFKLEDVPEALRKRIEASLAQTVKAIAEAAKKNVKAESVAPQWKLQPVPSQDVADEAVKLMRKYGQRRPDADIPFYQTGSPVGQITVRCAPVLYGTPDEVSADGKLDEKKRRGVRTAPKGADDKPLASGWYIRYAAKPLEGKGRSAR